MTFEGGAFLLFFLSLEHLFNLASYSKADAQLLSDVFIKIFEIIFGFKFTGNEFDSNLIQAGGFSFEFNSDFPQEFYNFMRWLNKLNWLRADFLNAGYKSSLANASGS
jgi:hypothetical protein